jgi:response regulator RpfG family c-di-GMP phosphodiesterase
MLLDQPPRKDGREVLAEVKEDPDLRTIPVVVLTTSDAEEDIARSYDLHANAYVSKPVDFDRFIEVVRRSTTSSPVVKLPNRHRSTHLRGPRTRSDHLPLHSYPEQPEAARRRPAAARSMDLRVANRAMPPSSVVSEDRRAR